MHDALWTSPEDPQTDLQACMLANAELVARVEQATQETTTMPRWYHAAAIAVLAASVAASAVWPWGFAA